MQYMYLNWERQVVDLFFNLGDTGVNELEVTLLQSQLYIK